VEAQDGPLDVKNVRRYVYVFPKSAESLHTAGRLLDSVDICTDILLVWPPRSLELAVWRQAVVPLVPVFVVGKAHLRDTLHCFCYLSASLGPHQ